MSKSIDLELYYFDQREILKALNPFTAKLFYLNVYPLQVGENFSYLSDLIQIAYNSD